VTAAACGACCKLSGDFEPSRANATGPRCAQATGCWLRITSKKVDELIQKKEEPMA